MSEASLPSVSVLVSSKDRRDLLRAAVRSLREMDYPADRLEIVVVEETDEPDDPGADRYVPLPRSGRGFAWSRNRALAAASHPVVAFTDDDCLVDRDWLRRLVAPLADPGVAAVAGGVLAQPCGTLGKTEIVLGFPGGGLRRIVEAGGRIVPTRDLSTVNVAARRDLLRALGGFAEATGVYGGEDSELFGRLTDRYRAVFEPRALVYHRARDSWTGIARWFVRRGVAAVALTRLDRRRRRRLLFDHLRGSLTVRASALVGAALALGIPVGVAVLAAGALHTGVLLYRFRFARALGARVWASAPFVRLWMDTFFELGRLRGLALWLGGRLAAEPATEPVPGAAP